jgi:hypothetical protein
MEALSILLISLAIVSVKRQWPSYITGIIAGLGAMTHPPWFMHVVRVLHYTICGEDGNLFYYLALPLFL